MFDPYTLLASLESTLSNPDIVARINEVRESLQKPRDISTLEEVWFCYQIAPGSDGVYQWQAASTFFGIEWETGMKQPERIWDDIYLEADSLVDALNKELAHSLPPGCHLSTERWGATGCYGVVLNYNHSKDDRNFHTVRFALEDWQELQWLSWALDDARTAVRVAAAHNDMMLACTHQEDTEKYSARILSIMEGYLV